MSRLFDRVAKLRGRSLHELRTRGRQSLAAAIERHGPSMRSEDGDAASLDSLLTPVAARRAHAAGSLRALFGDRPVSRFFAGLDDRDATIEALRCTAPEAERQVIARADAAVAGRFSFLGHADLSFGDPIDWWLDPVAGRRAPAAHWSRIAYLDPAVVGDHKIVWELNRHQHFVTLGQAYWYTKDERYARAFAAQLAAWLDANPPKVGINWASSLEVAFRSISWVWALHFFRHSPELTESLFARAMMSLHVHATHLETYLSTYFSPNTHLTGEALGLFYLGAVFPELRAAERWRGVGWRVLTEQMSRQVRRDGIYFEQATCYQRYTTEFYLHLLLLAERSESDRHRARRVLEPTLLSLLDAVMLLQRPDGCLPLLGDDDGGQLVLLDERTVCDVRGALGVGAGLFDRGDYRAAAGPPGAASVWLLGPTKAARLRDMPVSAPVMTSHAFPDGGWVVMRDGWTRDANYLVVDCGPHGADTCGHAHADALAIEVVSHGVPMIVDPGTYTYTADPVARDHFRGTRAHNTVMLDGMPSSVPAQPFRWTRTADGRLDAWDGTERVEFVSGHHDGFAHLPGAPRVRRSVLFVRGDYWVVRDQVESSDAHWIRVGYQCAAGVQVVRWDDRSVELRAADGTGLLLTIGSLSGQIVVGDGIVSPSYGTRIPAPRIEFVLQASRGADITTIMIPLAAGQPSPEITHGHRVAGVRSVVVSTAGFRDTMLVGGDSTTRDDIDTDAECAWVRRDARSGEVIAVALAGGCRLAVDGVEHLRFDTPRIVAHRAVHAPFDNHTESRAVPVLAGWGD